MKHTLSVTAMLVLLFLAAQFIGLYIVDQRIDKEATAETGELTFSDTPGVGTPEVPRENVGEVIFLFVSAILIGTGLVLLIIKFKKRNLWRLWFFISVFVCLYSAFYPILNNLSIADDIIIWSSAALALVLGGLKVIKSNVYIHNLTELFIYGGLASIFVPIINLISASILLLVISAYDMFAVWQSKHMVSMAKFQTKSNLFAGLSIKYDRKPSEFDSKELVEIYKPKAGKKVKPEVVKARTENRKRSSAILGGGDIAFPLIFASAVMIDFGFWKAAAVVVTTTISLITLFALAEKDKFYPAMPFISGGCFAGFGIVLLLGLL